jgi:type II secretory pathway pseudopilin PulG
MRTALHQSRARNAAGFTLVEILVAEAIFLILLVIVLQVIFGLIQTSASQKKRMDSLGDARQALDRVSLDWSSRVRRSDVGGLFTKNAVGGAQAGNDQIGLLSQLSAYSTLPAGSPVAPSRRLAWITYQVNSIPQVVQGSVPTSTYALVRGILGYNYTSVSGAYPVMQFPAAQPDLTNATLDPLANTVFRFEYCFLQQVPAGAAASTAFNASKSLDLTSSNLVGIVVAVAALDPESRQIVNQAQLVKMANALPDAVDGQDPQSLWIATMNAGTFATAATAAGVPTSVIGSVRIFQRILYIKE